ncbi:MAG TPA: S8 family peptidase [Solirubrobacteraceae bacterium]|nr:S8 family peptidase [Solirubrobacteraceae bacterium]
MTSSIGFVDRIRWLSALAASTVLALVAAVALHQWQPTAIDSGSAASPSAPAGSSAPLDPRIASLAAHRPAASVSAIVQFKAGVSLERARWIVSRAGGHVFGQLHIINALAVRLPAERARWLARNPGVHSVSLNSAIKTQDWGLNAITGSMLGSLQTTYDQTLNVLSPWSHGYTGAGVGVAVIDTGIAGGLPDFQGSNGSSRVVETAVTNPYATTATDGYGHGTDVAGIIAGNGLNRPSGDPLDGQYIGVAPNANLISVKVSDDQGNSTVLDVIYGLQFVVDHQSDYNIRVVNMSLDSTTPQSYTSDPLDAAAESAWMHGIVVVAAAGNRGTAPDAVQYAPANDPYVITVGAVDENGQSNPANDTVASWSSQGTTQDGFQKPDVYAPGAHIVSVLAPNSAFASMCPSCVIGGAYIKTGGTSMAAPMISGLVADLLQQHPSLTPNQVKGALTSSWVSSNSNFQEPDANRLFWMWSPPVANRGLTPNTLITDPQGNIDYSRSSWSRSSWSTATGSLSAGFARSSWSCTCSTTSTGSIDPSRSSWSSNSWSTYFGQ